MFINLDHIVRNVLSARQYSYHWYIQFMGYAVDIVRELTFDVLKNTESKVLEVSDTGEVELPVDYVDWVRIGFQNGQRITP